MATCSAVSEFDCAAASMLMRPLSAGMAGLPSRYRICYKPSGEDKPCPDRQTNRPAAGRNARGWCHMARCDVRGLAIAFSLAAALLPLRMAHAADSATLVYADAR